MGSLRTNLLAQKYETKRIKNKKKSKFLIGNYI